MMDLNLRDALPAPAVESLACPPTTSWPIATVVCLMAFDVMAIILAMLTASALRDLLLSSPFSAIISTQVFPAILLTLCSLTAAGLYPGVTVNPVEELRRSTRAVTLAFLTLWSATLFFRDLRGSRLIYLIGYLLAVCLIPLLRAAARSTCSAKPWWGSQVAILGFGATGKSVYSALKANPGIGLKPVAILDDNPRQYLEAGGDLLRGPLSRCSDIAGDQKIPYGIICMPRLSRHDLLTIVEHYGQCFGHLIVIPNLVGIASLGITAREVGGIVGLELRKPLLLPSARLLKRVLDLLVTILMAIPIAAILTIFAVLLRIEGAGPVFYGSERVGFRGERFKAWKLRSMVTNGDAVLATYLASNPEEAISWNITQKLKRDPRVTRVGAFIRKTSIDELPQFWNVFVGEMSVVGPRPILERQIPLYGDGYGHYKQMRPGITGLWQISGRNNLSFEDRSRLDRYVIQNWSVWLDIYILARTPLAVPNQKGCFLKAKGHGVVSRRRLTSVASVLVALLIIFSLQPMRPHATLHGRIGHLVLHVAGFGFTSFVCLLPADSRTEKWIALGALFGLAVAIELGQCVIFGNNLEWNDVLLDCLGALSAFILIYLFKAFPIRIWRNTSTGRL